MLEQTKKGLEHFKRKTYKEYENLYKDLEHTQHPHTLFITCSDSRIHPEKLMHLEPGEVFMIRNIANMVPSFEAGIQDIATVSAIEYAVEVLNVKQVIVCGHSNCGGCSAVLSGTENVPHLPYTQKYLNPLESIKNEIEHLLVDTAPETQARLMEQKNVAAQIKHIKEYPIIRERLEKGDLVIEGWHYSIGSGEVAIYDEHEEEFNSFGLADSLFKR